MSMPFKKRSSIFLDSSESEDEDESFHPDDDEKNEKCLASDEDTLADVENSIICTQPASSSIKDQGTKERERALKSSCLNSYGSLVMDTFTTQPLGDKISTKMNSPTVTKKINAKVVTDITKPTELSDTESIVIVDAPPRKKSKLRLKLKMNRSKNSKKHDFDQIQTDSIIAESSVTEGEGESCGATSDACASAADLQRDRNCDDGIVQRDSNNLDMIMKIDLEKAHTHVNKSRPPVDLRNVVAKPASGVKRKKKRKVPNPSSSTPQECASMLSKTCSASPHKKRLKPNRKKNTFQQKVILHIITTMKPFTLKTLAAELNTTDTALSHLMLSLLDKKIVSKKLSGKKKTELYWVDLEKATKEYYGKEIPSQEGMKSSKVELEEILGKEASLMKVLKGMESELSNDELSKTLVDNEKGNRDMKKRVQDIKDRIEGKSGVPTKAAVGSKNSHFARFPVPPKKPKTRIQLLKDINNLRAEWKSRKEKCVDFLDNMSDAIEKRPKDVIKMLEIETDAMMGVKIPAKKMII